MTHDEMIAVLQAHRDGKKIEVRSVGSNGAWFIEDNPRFNFGCIEHRIAEPKWRDAIIDDIKRAPLKCRVRDEDTGWVESELLGASLFPVRRVWRWKAGINEWSFCQVIDE